MLLAGSLEADPAKTCEHMNANDPLQSRFGYITHAMTVAADGAVYLTDQPCRADSGQADAVRKMFYLLSPILFSCEWICHRKKLPNKLTGARHH